MVRVSAGLVCAVLVASVACSDDEKDATPPPSSAASTPTTVTTAGPRPQEGVDLSAAGFQPITMVTDGSSLWLAGAGPEGGRVAHVSIVEAPTLTWTVDVPDTPVGLAVTSGGVLFAAGGGDGANPTGGVTRLDAASGKVLGTLELPDGSPYGVAATPRAVWVTDARTDRVWRLDPKTGAVTATVRVAPRPTGIGYAGDSLWVASPDPGTVTRLDATTGATQGSLAVPTANSVAANANAVWVGGSALVRLDPQTGAPTGRITTPGVVTAQTLSPGWVWAHHVGGGLVRGETDGLRIDSQPVAAGDFIAATTTGDTLWVSDGARLVQHGLPLPTTLDLAAETPRAGTNFGFIRQLDGEEVAFDPAEDLHDPTATRVAVVDGIGITEDEGLPNGFYDRNRDGKTYRLPLRADAQLLVLRGSDPSTPVAVDRDTFRRALTATAGGEFYGAPALAPFRLSLDGGAVTRLEQIYRP